MRCLTPEMKELLDQSIAEMQEELNEGPCWEYADGTNDCDGLGEL